MELNTGRRNLNRAREQGENKLTTEPGEPVPGNFTGGTEVILQRYNRRKMC